MASFGGGVRGFFCGWPEKRIGFVLVGEQRDEFSVGFDAQFVPIRFGAFHVGPFEGQCQVGVVGLRFGRSKTILRVRHGRFHGQRYSSGSLVIRRRRESV